MKKNYQILVKAYAVVLVERAESEEKAFEYAQDALSTGDFEVEGMTIESIVKDGAEFQNAKKHADLVAEEEE